MVSSKNMENSFKSFQKTVRDYYNTAGRHDLPWRKPGPNNEFDPYKIMVSEVMLQQTQVPRVIPKFELFMQQFPTVQALADAPLSSVLKVWSGLGYNRRAKFLWQAARTVAHELDGKFPATKEDLVRLPGIGANTAGAILVYAHNQPGIFIETNIRTVFIYHFFPNQEKVSDADLAEVIGRTLPSPDVRSWYWALMDYGTYLKQTTGNASRRSAHYAKQSRFEGSKRQIRGQVLRLLGQEPQSASTLREAVSDDRLETVLEDLLLEGFIEQQDGLLKLRDL